MPGPHAASLARLVELDAIDQELLALEAERTETPKGLAARQEEIDSASGARDSLKAALADKEAAQRSAERELEEVETRVARAHKRMESLFTNEQIEATERELTKLAEQQDTLEGTVLELMDEVEDLSGRLETANSAIAEATGALTADREAWAAREAVLVARIAELDREGARVRPTIDAEAMKAYRIGFENRRNRNPRGVTWTDGIMCIQCRTESPARWVNEARNGDGIQRCLGCKRVLVGAAPGTTDEEQ